MCTSFCAGYGEFAVRAGLVACANDKTGQGCFGTAWLITKIPEIFMVALVTVHLLLAMAPIWYMRRIYQVAARLTATDPPAPPGAGCNCVAAMLWAMPLFTVSSFAEIAQHTSDNWLNLGLIPTVCNASFYGLLALAQSVLAWGAQNPSKANSPGWCTWIHTPCAYWVQAMAGDVTALAALGFLLVASNGVPYVINGCSYGSDKAPGWADCCGDFGVLWGCVFAVLTFNTAAVFIRTWVDAERLKQGQQIKKSAAGYLAGVFLVILASKSGCQFLHLAGASGFLFGFHYQMQYVLLLACGDYGDTPIPASKRE
jgi:hypothetical protein